MLQFPIQGYPYYQEGRNNLSPQINAVKIAVNNPQVLTSATPYYYPAYYTGNLSIPTSQFALTGYQNALAANNSIPINNSNEMPRSVVQQITTNPNYATIPANLRQENNVGIPTNIQNQNVISPITMNQIPANSQVQEFTSSPEVTQAPNMNEFQGGNYAGVNPNDLSPHYQTPNQIGFNSNPETSQVQGMYPNGTAQYGTSPQGGIQNPTGMSQFPANGQGQIQNPNGMNQFPANGQGQIQNPNGMSQFPANGQEQIQNPTGMNQTPSNGQLQSGNPTDYNQNLAPNQAQPFNQTGINQNNTIPNQSGVNQYPTNAQIQGNNPNNVNPTVSPQQGSGAQNDNINSGNNTQNNVKNSSETEEIITPEKKRKRKIVQLTDEYIMNLERYLNSQDKTIRLSAAKEVYERLKEDESRCDDLALNALINKMLQDPSDEIRIFALSALDAGYATGDKFTVTVLTNMQNSSSGYGFDSADAARILLKMSGKRVEKEFEIKDESLTKKVSKKKD